MKIKEVVDALERFAPLPLQESYDNAGLQIGLTEAEVSGALLCLDVTDSIVDEAMCKGCNLIVSHHPLIFHKLAHLVGETYVERAVMKAVKNDIAIISMHTNMDAARGGVNYRMAEKLGLCGLEFFGGEKQAEGVVGGNGVVGEFSETIDAERFFLLLKETFKVDSLQVNEPLNRPIKRVALCGGAGSFLLPEALKAGADAFVTGEMHYHEFFGQEQMIQIAVLGHYQSEQYTTEVFREILKPMGVRCVTTSINTNPIIYK